MDSLVCMNCTLCYGGGVFKPGIRPEIEVKPGDLHF